MDRAIGARNPLAALAAAGTVVAALATVGTGGSGGTTPTAAGAPRLLDAKEAAKRLHTSPDWLYRHAGSLPFTVRLSRRQLRFDRQGLERWLTSRGGAS
jgi:predicted DNA-binding transcriptional regulator AlpA